MAETPVSQPIRNQKLAKLQTLKIDLADVTKRLGELGQTPYWAAEDMAQTRQNTLIQQIDRLEKDLGL